MSHITPGAKPNAPVLVRRLLRVGPGLVLALVAIVVMWPRLRPPGPVIAPASSPAAAIPRPPAAPDLNWVLEHRESLALTTEQERRLRRLEARWDRETAPVREALDRASSEFRRELDRGVERGIAVGAVQVQGSTVADLSRRLAATRRAYWNEASPFLTDSQRRKVESGWSPVTGISPVSRPASPGL